ncbi:MAG TPA: NAD(P)-dependent oxidoreductase [Pseudolabrys sp.]|nr:NAD(P)-dependent oxidoreductase [Pseudolabrys sp.]
MTARPRACVLACHQQPDKVRPVFTEALSDIADVRFLSEAGAKRRQWLAEADVLLSFLPHSEIETDEWSVVRAKLLQVATAGVNHLHFDMIPQATAVAPTIGVQSPAIAEHVLAFALAAAKGLFQHRSDLARGEFNFMAETRMLAGATCCVIGLGQVGRATARLFQAVGMKVNAINSSGVSDDSSLVAVGTLEDFAEMVADAQVVVITLPLTERTSDLIGVRQLATMRRDATLINVGRGRIINQQALYDHLVANPAFTACLDAWWEEPFNEGRFHVNHPFFDLPNLLGTPHNASRVPGMAAAIAERAAANVRHFLTTGEVLHRVPEEDRRWV